MMMNQFHTVYFIGIGGIGMSALARYFKAMGKRVEGYDKTRTVLTKSLESEGIQVHYKDLGNDVLSGLSKEETLVIYTPAVPKEFGELVALQNNGYEVVKRAKALGIISHEFTTYAIAGTHGKTTTTSILAHVLSLSNEGCNAFIGGISSNFNSNCVINENSNRVVLEADEFDRSFLTLRPNYSIITSIDADHLDIYGDGSALEDSFNDFAALTNPTGALIVEHKSVSKIQTDRKVISYGSDAGDYQLTNYHFKEGKVFFDIQEGSNTYSELEFGIPGRHNAENATGVFALCMQIGVPLEVIREGFKTYKGVKRRFEYHIRTEDQVMIDDYAHHPTEISAFLSAVKELYPNKKLTAAFQPHLFSRTQDFMDEFAESLSMADELYLLPIYPARELPIPGVTSEVLLDKITLTNKQMSSKATLAQDMKRANPELCLILGAGDIDTCVLPVKEALES